MFAAILIAVLASHGGTWHERCTGDWYPIEPEHLPENVRKVAE